MARRIFPLAVWVAALIVLALSMTHTPARPEAAKRPLAPTAAVPVSPAVGPPRALASEDGVESHNCFAGDNSSSCQRIFRTVRKNPNVITVPQASGDELAAIEARDARWVARCRPSIRQDAYGMPRYIYAAPGCEYGRLD